MNEFKNKLSSKVKVVVISHASNVLGNIYPVGEICKLAHQYNAIVVVDGSQAVPNMSVDVKSLDCDFYAFSGHKMLAPFGIGVLWGKKELLENITPLYLGGGTVLSVDMGEVELSKLPDRLEYGTPNVGGAYALSTAIEYLENFDIKKIGLHEQELVDLTIKELSKIEGVKIIGPKDSKDRVGLVSFYIENIHSHDVSAILNSFGVATRSGLHCAMNLHNQLDYPPTTRASFYIYNDEADVEVLIKGVNKAKELLG